MTRWIPAGFGTLLLLAGAVAVTAQPAAQDTVRDRVRAYRAAHEKEIVGELTGLLALPNVATRVPDIERNADRLTAMLERRGFKVQRLSAGPDTPPALYGGLLTPGRKGPLIFSPPYEGQPLDQRGGLPAPLNPLLPRGPLG